MTARSRAGSASDHREDGVALTLVVVLLLAITGAGLYWTPKPTTRRYLAETANYLKSGLLRAARPVGTSGAAASVATDGEPAPALIRDIETITGTIDGHELIGRRVDLRVPVVATAGAVGYWVGPIDNRVLVITAPDAASGVTATHSVNSSPTPNAASSATPAAGQSATHATGQIAAVAGVIKRLPADAAARWSLPDADGSILADRPVFILAN